MIIKNLAGKRHGMLHGGGRALIAVLLALAGLAPLTGCETDSFFDPSVVGRWERTPVTLPILDRLDVIEGPENRAVKITDVRPEDLVPSTRPYVIGPSDTLTVQIFELLRPGETSAQTRRVTNTGIIRLQVVGPVKAAGLSPAQLEDRITKILEQRQILQDAQVSVLLQQARGRTFSIIAEPNQDGTRVGTYAIPEPNFRLLEALALSGGVSGQTDQLLIYRQTALTPEAAGRTPTPRAGEGMPTEEEGATPTEEPAELIKRLMEDQPSPPRGEEGRGQPNPNQPEQQPDQGKVPSAIEQGVQSGGQQWVNVDGKWVKVGNEAGAPSKGQLVEGVQLKDLVTQRIIRVPYDKLKEGDMRYNVVIRAGDVIRVPSRAAGFVYVMGQINRPGSYVVPGESELTLKQLVASAGNLSAVAIPTRVDLIRRVGDNREAVMRLDLEAIFDGRQPDIYLKPDDLINVGTNFVATPLAIIRNGFRATYGFGFIIDRNFAFDVFGPPG